MLKIADIKHWIGDIYNYQIDPDYFEQKLINLEDRSIKITRGDTARLWRKIASSAPGKLWIRMPYWNGMSTSKVK